MASAGRRPRHDARLPWLASPPDPATSAAPQWLVPLPDPVTSAAPQWLAPLPDPVTSAGPQGLAPLPDPATSAAPQGLAPLPDPATSGEPQRTPDLRVEEQGGGRCWRRGFGGDCSGRGWFALWSPPLDLRAHHPHRQVPWPGPCRAPCRVRRRGGRDAGYWKSYSQMVPWSERMEEVLDSSR